jgi:hypothetical protein
MRFQTYRATPPACWPPLALVKASPQTLAKVSDRKLAAVAALWRSRWGWSRAKCLAALRDVREARREAKRAAVAAARTGVPPLKLTRPMFRMSLPSSTQPEVIAFIRAAGV